mmetsp:Transcript_88190/g.175130  ORF Transcript_88190/g.175130 Transcript_88190/m.175130 type:complete len:355 (+) Transcript_88190:107-1171(+)
MSQGTGKQESTSPREVCMHQGNGEQGCSDWASNGGGTVVHQEGAQSPGVPDTIHHICRPKQKVKTVAWQETTTWLACPQSNLPICIRDEPDINGPRTEGFLVPGEAFCVCEERPGKDDVLYLELADGRGWAFDRKLDGRVMCVRLQSWGVNGNYALDSPTTEQQAPHPRNYIVDDIRLKATHPRDYIVDNSILKADSPGLGYFFSKNLDDPAGMFMYKSWGTTVTGVDEGDGWLQVGDRYLPLTFNGIRVLTPKARQLHKLEVDAEEERPVQDQGALKDEGTLPCDGFCCRPVEQQEAIVQEGCEPRTLVLDGAMPVPSAGAMPVPSAGGNASGSQTMLLSDGRTSRLLSRTPL